MNTNHFAAAAIVAGVAMLAPGCAQYGDFNLPTADGAKMALSEQKGKAVLVTFWAVG